MNLGVKVVDLISKISDVRSQVLAVFLALGRLHRLTSLPSSELLYLPNGIHCTQNFIHQYTLAETNGKKYNKNLTNTINKSAFGRCSNTALQFLFFSLSTN